eukprot:gene10502-21905_t
MSSICAVVDSGVTFSQAVVFLSSYDVPIPTWKVMERVESVGVMWYLSTEFKVAKGVGELDNPFGA